MFSTSTVVKCGKPDCNKCQVKVVTTCPPSPCAEVPKLKCPEPVKCQVPCPPQSPPRSPPACPKPCPPTPCAKMPECPPPPCQPSPKPCDEFNLEKYMGCWYTLAYYPEWYTRNDMYNMKAGYKMNADGTVMVHNSGKVAGVGFDSYGTARPIPGRKNAFQVDFPLPEMMKLQQTGLFKMPRQDQLKFTYPNYVVDRVFVDGHGEYSFAIVSDDQKKSFYLLSRNHHPSEKDFAKVMQYVMANYDATRLVQAACYH